MGGYRIWAVRAGSAGEADSTFLSFNQIAVGFGDVDGDMSKLPASRGAFKEAFGRSQTVRQNAVPIQAGQLYRFVHELHIGDRVIYPRRADRTLHWGEIVGPYVYDSDAETLFPHRRAVKWRGKLSRDAFTPGALYELGSTLTLFEVKSFADELIRKFEPANVATADTLSGLDDESELEVARDICEATRDFIARKIRTELKGVPFEPFVADLFRAMGYRAHATRAVRDDGIDVIAHRDELGIEPPILKVQVKVNDANIGADCVKAFYAMVHERDVGIFMTTSGYSSLAIAFARTKANLKLVDGAGLVDLIQKYYDSLDIKYRRQIPLRHILVPDAALLE
jgi:restriction system protein